MTEQQPHDPSQWLKRALSSLAKARQRAPEILFEDLCFDAQQAAEKAIKAMLINRRADFPYTHNLSELLTLLEKTGCPVPDSIKQAEVLTDYAVGTRYPGVAEPVTEREYEEAIALAQRVIDWAKQQIK